MSDDKTLPDVHFGAVGMASKLRATHDDDPDDDEELANTPQDVIAILGFDPLEEKSKPSRK